VAVRARSCTKLLVASAPPVRSTLAQLTSLHAASRALAEPSHNSLTAPRKLDHSLRNALCVPAEEAATAGAPLLSASNTAPALA